MEGMSRMSPETLARFDGENAGGEIYISFDGKVMGGNRGGH